MTAQKISICTDTACNLSDEWLKEHGVGVLSLGVTLDGRECSRELLNNPDSFYDAIRRGARPSTNSLPDGSIESGLREMLSWGRDVLYIGLPAALSGNFQRMRDIAADVSANSKRRICCMDARIAVKGHALLIEEAVRLRDEGKSLAEIRPVLEKLSDHIRIFFMLDDPQYLKSGGRGEEALSWAARFASKLSVRPVLIVDHLGALKFHSVCRSRKRAMSLLVDRLCTLRDPHDDQVFYIHHTGALSLAEQLAEEIRLKFGSQQQIEIGDIPLVIGAHVGPGAIGLIFMGTTAKTRGSVD
jgi:DegV family protein with EDD domain